MGILSIAITCEAQGWRGIVPLHSTKADVNRVLGTSADANEVRSVYQLEHEEVYIVFSGKQFCDPEVTKIPAGTVLLVQITPRGKLTLGDIELDRKNLREFRPSSEDSNWQGFIDDEHGIMIRSFKGNIDKIFYIATAKDRMICANYYSKPEEFARIVIHFNSGRFDQYSELSFADEKARLDNFAIYLLEEKPTWKAYVIGYPAGNAVGIARQRVDRAKQYLIDRGVSKERIETLIGGCRNQNTIELHALPPEAASPIPNPK
jgi:hypothetical protein